MTAEVVCVSGTGTGVGKTMVTAAAATLARFSGQRVAVIKLAQTGTVGSDGGAGDRDAAVIRALSGLPAEAVVELATYPEPLAPATAARRSGLPALTLAAATAAVLDLAADHDVVLVEGAGGLLVAFDDPPHAWTIADLAVELDAPVLVVTAAGLGTLNHTALTMEALTARGIEPVGVVIGTWPGSPGLAECCNLADLGPHCGARLVGALPEGAADLSASNFADLALASLAPVLGGRFDEAHFRALHVPPRETSPAPDPKASE